MVPIYILAFTCLQIVRLAGVEASDRSSLCHVVVGLEPPKYRRSPVSFKPLSYRASRKTENRNKIGKEVGKKM